MQAVILAGGKGTRLYPLTSRTPKPMVNVFNKPVLEHTIELLKKHDVRDIIITVAYKADQIIDYFGGGSKWGVNIQYAMEDIPLGTAGGLRRMQPLLRDTFLIISGDAITDFDLSTAIAHHKNKSAVATMLLYEVDNPSQFGIVESHSDGRIARFLEKPSPSETFTNTINTGVYILEPEVISYIPHDTPYDFSRNIFPRLLQNQEPFYAYRTEGYWCDVGSLAQYRNVHFDALTGRVKLNLSAQRIADGIYVGADADIHSSVKLKAPFYVGSGSEVQRGSRLGRFAVIGDASCISEGAHVTQSILGMASSVGRDAQVFGSVVGTGYTIQDGRQLEDEVVVRDTDGEHLTAEIGSGLLSQLVSEEHLFTWSGLELARFAAERASSARAVAA